MGIRNWHSSKIVLLWLTYFFVVIITWAATVEINDSYVHLLSAPLALLWFLIFIPLFAITWRWTTGLQKTSDFTQGEQLAQVSTLDLPRRTRFYAIGYRKIVWVIVVATVGAAGGYWYKDFESRASGTHTNASGYEVAPGSEYTVEPAESPKGLAEDARQKKAPDKTNGQKPQNALEIIDLSMDQPEASKGKSKP